MLRIPLRRIVLALGILGPIEREAIAHQPIGKINAINRTNRYSAAVTVSVHG
jgi:hypothetical protein